MNAPLLLPQLLDEWYRWADWVSDPERDKSEAKDLVGWNEFDWAVNDFRNWQYAMSEAIWSRVQAVWDRRGWDGVPPT